MGAENLMSNYDFTNRIFHVLLGLVLFFGFLYAFQKIIFHGIPTIIAKFDRLSYIIYLSHFPVMIGPFSLCGITPWIPVNVVVMVLASAFVTIVVYKMTQWVNHRFLICKT